MPPCLTLCIISRSKWSNPEKGIAPFSTPRCSRYSIGNIWVVLVYSRSTYYIYIYICVCVCVCSIFVFKHVCLNKTDICVNLFCLWSVQVCLQIVWLLDGMNLGMCCIFSRYFRLPKRPISREQIINWKLQWCVIYITTKSRKNEWEGHSWKKRILQGGKRKSWWESALGFDNVSIFEVDIV